MGSLHREDQLNLDDLAFPLVLRPDKPPTDEELIRFSKRNRLYKIERNKHGNLTIMTPLGGLGGTHEMYVSYKFMDWSEQDGTGMAFSPNTGFNLPDSSTLSPDVAWLPLSKWNSLTFDQQKSFPPFCPAFLIEVCSKTDRHKVLEEKMQIWLDNGASSPGWSTPSTPPSPSTAPTSPPRPSSAPTSSTAIRP